MIQHFFFKQSFSDCIRGCVPAFVSIALAEGSKSLNSTPGATQLAIITFLKSFLSSNKGWGFSLLKALLQDITDE